MNTTSMNSADKISDGAGSAIPSPSSDDPTWPLDKLTQVIEDLGLPTEDTLADLLTEAGDEAKYDELRSKIAPNILERAIETEKTFRIVDPTARLILRIFGDAIKEGEGAAIDGTMLEDGLDTYLDVHKAWTKAVWDTHAAQHDAKQLFEDVHEQHDLPLAISDGFFPAAGASSNAKLRMEELLATGTKLADLVRGLLQRRRALRARMKTLQHGHFEEIKRVTAGIDMKGAMASLARLKEYAMALEAVGIVPEGSAKQHGDAIKECIGKLLDAHCKLTGGLVPLGVDDLGW